jgi:Tfp pilus assembly protein PilV
MRHIKLNQKGDTLIEVLFAITVLAVVLSSCFVIANRAITTSRLNYERTQAIKYAETQVEMIKSISSAMSGAAFASSYKAGNITSGDYCLTSSNQLVIKTDSQCSRNGLYNLTLTYINPGSSEETGYFISKVVWDQTKEVELLYRVYSELSSLSISGQPQLSAGKNTVASLAQASYTNATWATLQAALSLPETFAAQIAAKAIAIDTAINNLQQISNTSAYSATVAAVQPSIYTPASWATYQSVVTANTVTNQNTQAQVDTATTNIRNAQASLVILQPPATPTIANNGAGQFVITNYNPSYTYNLSTNSGAISRNGSTVYCSGTTATCTTSASNGPLTSGSVNYQRSPFTYYYYLEFHLDYWILQGGLHGNYGFDGPGPARSCTYYGWWGGPDESGCHYGYTYWQQAQYGPPGGFSNSGGDWFRIY